MLFIELRFLFFFVAVLAVYWALRWNRARKVWLLAASCAFYCAWDWRFLGLLLFTAGLDFYVALGFERVRTSAARRALLMVSLTANFGFLCFFKYWNFFAESGARFLAWLGIPASAPTLAIVLPIGISFYTFHTLSYTIDAYRGKLRPIRLLTDFMLFVTFFPAMVAGPIVRAAQFLPQLETPRRWRDVEVRAALVLFLIGFLKKACISDNLAPSIERYFADPASFGALSAWIGVLAYAVQIYSDFSGYTDMALAVAALLGYRLTINFDRPYLSADVVEFWRRWHISLSTWLRDYLYIALGGNRGARWKTYRNLMLTMLLGGLWHGAGWNFVLWGGLHGAALSVQRMREDLGLRFRLPRWLAIPATFWFVCVCWIFFRAADMERAGTILRGFVLFRSTGAESLDPRLLLVLAALALVHVAGAKGILSGWWRRTPAWAFAGSYALLVAAVLPFVSVDFVPFIYFQF